MNLSHELSQKEKKELRELANLFQQTSLEARNAIYWFIMGTMVKNKIAARPASTEINQK